jgi:hypothetical protein
LILAADPYVLRDQWANDGRSKADTTCDQEFLEHLGLSPIALTLSAILLHSGRLAGVKGVEDLAGGLLDDFERGRAPVQRSRNFRRFGLTRCAAALSVEGSRLARRPPRKRREAAFTPRSVFKIGNGLNSSKRDDIQTMDRPVFRALFFRRNRTEKPG